jgi:hypothetical protein
MAKSTNFDVRYDRRVDADFLDLFKPAGPLARLTEISRRAAFPLDLQMRRDPRHPNKQWATLYVGLTGVLYVYKTVQGVRFDAHNTWSGKDEKNSKYGFGKLWLNELSLSQLEESWMAVELYLEKVIPAAVRSHGLTEGAVQAVVSNSKTTDWAILDREVLPSYRDASYKKDMLLAAMRPILAVKEHVQALGQAIPGGPTSLGAECDLLAVDTNGRVLAIEVKPASGGTVAWVPAQAAMYARLLQQWIDAEPEHSREVITGTLLQRQALGHSTEFNTALPAKLTVTPVVVLQRGATSGAIGQMRAVRDVINARVKGLAPIEIYEVSILGDFTPLP